MPHTHAHTRAHTHTHTPHLLSLTMELGEFRSPSPHGAPAVMALRALVISRRLTAWEEKAGLTPRCYFCPPSASSLSLHLILQPVCPLPSVSTSLPQSVILCPLHFLVISCQQTSAQRNLPPPPSLRFAHWPPTLSGGCLPVRRLTVPSV